VIDPPFLAKDLGCDDEEGEGSDNGTLNAKGNGSSRLCDPLSLEVGNAETAYKC
jgi:hypothetical protein